MSQDSVLWLGDSEARFVHLSNARMERKTIRADQGEAAAHHHCTPKFHGGAGFFRAAVQEFSASERVIVVGPDAVIDQFKHFLKDHFPALNDRVLSWERMDKPVDSEIAAIATRFFTVGANGGKRA